MTDDHASKQMRFETCDEVVGLSIRQPWAELIVGGRKSVEVRTWRTRYRGTLWLHAGKRVEETVCERYQVPRVGLVTGAIVGKAELVDCIEYDAVTWRSQQPLHLNIVPFDRPYFGWILRNVVRVDAIPFIGKLGFMKIPAAVLGEALPHE